MEIDQYKLLPCEEGKDDLIDEKVGAYVVMTCACDWNVGFFQKNGYAVRGVLEDYPKGHGAYELQKRIYGEHLWITIL